MLVLWDSVPAAPVIVIVKVPVEMRAAAVSWSVVGVPGVAGFADQVGETRAGRPVTLIVTGLAKPFTGLTVTDSCVVLPRRKAALDGALTVKSAWPPATGAVAVDVA